ncbi:hypothetical protein SLE2022_076200 [Rubroshorea leprosula]
MVETEEASAQRWTQHLLEMGRINPKEPLQPPSSWAKTHPIRVTIVEGAEKKEMVVAPLTETTEERATMDGRVVEPWSLNQTHVELSAAARATQ